MKMLYQQKSGKRKIPPEKPTFRGVRPPFQLDPGVLARRAEVKHRVLQDLEAGRPPPKADANRVVAAINDVLKTLCHSSFCYSPTESMLVDLVLSAVSRLCKRDDTTYTRIAMNGIHLPPQGEQHVHRTDAHTSEA